MTSPVLGQSALHILLGSMTVDEEMLDMLLSHGANPYMPDKSGEFQNISFCTSHAQMLDMLLSHGAIPYMPDELSEFQNA